jgi:dCMP deaminase
LRGENNLRKSWDNYFIDMAVLASERATCERLKVGAVLVKDKRIIATGYNGSPAELPHCIEEGCHVVKGHCIRTIHAEQNALFQCSKYGASSEGATCYVTHAPCLLCSKSLIQSGIKEIVYLNDYKNDSNALEVLKASGVKIRKVEL